MRVLSSCHHLGVDVCQIHKTSRFVICWYKLIKSALHFFAFLSCSCRRPGSLIKIIHRMTLRATILLSLLLLSPLGRAEWRQLTESDDGDVHMVSYYEPGSLIRAKKPKISIMVIFSKPAPQFSWRVSKFLWEANCFSKQIRLLASVDFTQMGREAIPAMEGPYTEWMPPDDGTDKISVYNLLCRG